MTWSHDDASPSGKEGPTREFQVWQFVTLERCVCSSVPERCRHRQVVVAKSAVMGLHCLSFRQRNMNAESRQSAADNRSSNMKFRALESKRETSVGGRCDTPGRSVSIERQPDRCGLPPGDHRSNAPAACEGGSVRVCTTGCSLRSDRRPRWIRRHPIWPLRSQCDGERGACDCWRKYDDEGERAEEVTQFIEAQQNRLKARCHFERDKRMPDISFLC